MTCFCFYDVLFYDVFIFYDWLFIKFLLRVFYYKIKIVLNGLYLFCTPKACTTQKKKPKMKIMKEEKEKKAMKQKKAAVATKKKTKDAVEALRRFALSPPKHVIVDAFRALAKTHLARKVEFRFNARLTRSVGRCKQPATKKAAVTIEVGTHYLGRMTGQMVYTTLLHEISHAVCGHAAGHGPLWKAHNIGIGGDGKRCISMPDLVRPVRLACTLKPLEHVVSSGFKRKKAWWSRVGSKCSVAGCDGTLCVFKRVD